MLIRHEEEIKVLLMDSDGVSLERKETQRKMKPRVLFSSCIEWVDTSTNT